MVRNGPTQEGAGDNYSNPNHTCIQWWVNSQSFSKHLNLGHVEPAPTSAPSNGCPLLLSCRWTSSTELIFDFTLATNFVRNMSHKWVLVHCGQAQSVLLSGAHRYASVLAERTKDMMYKLNTNDSFLAHPVLISVPSPVSDNCYFTTHFHQFCSQFKCFSAFFHHANLLYSQHCWKLGDVLWQSGFRFWNFNDIQILFAETFWHDYSDDNFSKSDQNGLDTIYARCNTSSIGEGK